jgi:hypothetical protein
MKRTTPMSAVAVAVLVLAAPLAWSESGLAHSARHPGDANPCDLPSGVLDLQDLPEGTSVEECQAVGRTVENDGLALVIPEAGAGVGTEELYPDHALMFEVSVSDDGTITYLTEEEATTRERLQFQQRAEPAECSQDEYNTADLKEYGTYDWYIGDGSYPASMTAQQFNGKVANSINGITGAYNDCGLRDNVDASDSFRNYTDLESDMHVDHGTTLCGDGSTDGRDGSSVWDAANIDGHGDPPLAKTCSWTVPTPGRKNDLVEADVRFNITDYDFTINPTERCSQKYDVISIGTHEAGHVFGLAHVDEKEFPTMTMSTDASTCDISQRTLGLGDVKGLESIY